MNQDNNLPTFDPDFKQLDTKEQINQFHYLFDDILVRKQSEQEFKGIVS